MAQTPVNASSSSFISGHFGVIDLADDMVSFLVAEIDQHVIAGQRKAKNQLVANADGPWSIASRFLSVDVAYGVTNITAEGPPEVIDAIELLEFGSLEDAPVPYLRNAVEPIAEGIQSYLDSEVRKDVPLV